MKTKIGETLAGSALLERDTFAMSVTGAVADADAGLISVVFHFNPECSNAYFPAAIGFVVCIV
jgi:hypothetical protein